MAIVLTSCGAKNGITKEANQFGESNGYFLLTRNIISKKQFTSTDLRKLATFISEGVVITERIIPDSQDTNEKSFIDENGTLVDLTQIKINEGRIADGYKGSIEQGEEIHFVEKKNGYYVFKTASDIYMHFKIARSVHSSVEYKAKFGELTLVKLSNFDGVYDQSKFKTTHVLYRYERRQEFID